MPSGISHKSIPGLFVWFYFLFFLGVCSSVMLVRVSTTEDASPYRSDRLAKEGRCGESFRVPLPQPKGSQSGTVIILLSFFHPCGIPNSKLGSKG